LSSLSKAATIVMVGAYPTRTALGDDAILERKPSSVTAFELAAVLGAHRVHVSEGEYVGPPDNEFALEEFKTVR
jgi:sugar phosphate isomerase/epimerase